MRAGPESLSQNLLDGLRVGERQIFCQSAGSGGAHGADQRLWVGVGTNDERAEGRVLLAAHGEICDGLRIFADLSHNGGSHDGR